MLYDICVICICVYVCICKKKIKNRTDIKSNSIQT